MSSSSGILRQSPFRETEWDRRFNNLMDDLESSAAATTTLKEDRGGNSSSSRSETYRSRVAGGPSVPVKEDFPAPDNVLKDLNSALKASSNYIENHRTVTVPGSTQEYHEYRSYSSNADPPDFDLERRVQHMMPSSVNAYSPLNSANMVSSLSQNNETKSSSSSSKVQSSNTSYKTTDNKNTFDQNERPGSRLKQNIEELDTLLYDLNNAQKMSDTGGDYTASSITPGNISSDDYSFSESHQHLQQDRVKHAVHALNEFHSASDGKPPSPSPRRRFPSGGVTSLASPASVRKATGQHVYQTTTTTTTKTVQNHGPRDNIPTPDYQTSTSSQINSTGANSDYARSGVDFNRSEINGGSSDYARTKVSSSNADYGRSHVERTTAQDYGQMHSSGGGQDYGGVGVLSGSNQEYAVTSRSQSDHSKSQDFSRSGGPSTPDYTRAGTIPISQQQDQPTGAAYYAKYHSSHSQKSQSHQQTMAFPTSGRNTPTAGNFPTTSSSNLTQQPPKKVDELMTELSEFDPSIQPSGFVEPSPPNKNIHSSYRHDDEDTEYLLKKSNLNGNSTHDGGREPMPNRAGPAVYYPPGEMFSSEAAKERNASNLLQSNSGGKGKGKKGYSSKDKGKSSDSGGKQGAAVVPICLPLCCAAPCVIM